MRKVWVIAASAIIMPVAAKHAEDVFLKCLEGKDVTILEINDDRVLWDGSPFTGLDKSSIAIGALYIVFEGVIPVRDAPPAIRRIRIDRSTGKMTYEVILRGKTAATNILSCEKMPPPARKF